MSKKVVHKRMTFYYSIGYFGISLCRGLRMVNMNYQWKNVTCKKCLKGRKE